MGAVVQYDSSPQRIGGANVTEAIQSTDRLVFNESYTVIGEKLQASSICAIYDLNVIGDIEAEEIEIGGDLNITGNIRAKKIFCNNMIVCNGDIDAETVVGAEIIANNITCKELRAARNIIARMTVDVSESLESEQSVVSCEGIVGNGAFSALNAIAVDFFEFDGKVKGKVIEMATDDVFGEPIVDPSKFVDTMTYEEMLQLMSKKISIGIKEAGKVDEDELLTFINKISDGDRTRHYDWKHVMSRLVDLSYSDKITNFADYLIVVFARRILPKEVIEYETIEHVFKSMLPEAEKHLSSMDYHAKDMDEFARSLIISDLCQNEIQLERTEMLDRIFQSVGIKYKTITNYVG